MIDLKFTKEDASEAFYNIGKLAGRLSDDEGKRLLMLIQVIAGYTSELAEENKRLRDGDEFDMDGRC
jgi:hypothetical protein